MNTAAVRAVLRLARRDAARHKSRSFLIVLTLAFPVAGLIAAVTLLHALTVPYSTKATWQLGRADASVELDGDAAALQARLAGAVPSAPILTSTTGQSRITAADGSLETTQVTDLDYTAPLARGMVEQRTGHAPRTAQEVVVSSSVAKAAHLHLGSQVTLPDVGSRVATVVGTAVLPGELTADQVWLAPGSLAATGAAYGASTALVTLPPGFDVVAWADKSGGIAVTTRESLLHPVHQRQSPLQSQLSVGLTVLVSGLALLEAVLMAGAAFGVGARRSQRDLALLAATGGDAGQVRGVVLSGAVVLGAIAGVLGIGLGLLAGWALLPMAQDYSGHAYAGLRPRPLELVAAFGVGLGTALVSAWLPARGAARAPVVASLRGQRGVTRTSRARIGLALGTAAGGTLLCAWAGRSSRLGSHQFSAILLFAAVAELGFAGCAPLLVGLVGRFSGGLPLALRLSLRDISRNRNRTGPAVAAIMATLSGVVAMGVYVASEHARSEANFTPTLPATMVSLRGWDVALPDDLVRDVAGALPTTTITAYGDGQGLAQARLTPLLAPGANFLIRPVTVGTPALLTALGIPQAIPALAAGKGVLIDGRSLATGSVPVVVQDQAIAQGGTLTLPAKSDGDGGREVRLPAVSAHVGSYSALGGLIVSPATATKLGISAALDERLLTLSRPAQQREIDAAQSLLLARSTNPGGDFGLTTHETLNDNKLLLVPLALLAISTLVTFGVTAISTSLSAAESKGDFATLSAIGAQPAVRRRLAIGQATVLALLGGVLGIAAGLVPMAAVIAVRSDVLNFTVPWQVIALALVGVPLVAGVGAGVLTRARLPLVRRLT